MCQSSDGGKFNVVWPLSGSLSLNILTLRLLPMALGVKKNNKTTEIEHVFLTGLIMLIGHPNEIRKLTF